MVVTGNRKLSKYQQRKIQKCVLRTLDNLPMKYSFNDSLRLAHSCRSVRSMHMDSENSARRISENQTSNSRRLFEDVLNKSAVSDKPGCFSTSQTAAHSSPGASTVQGITTSGFIRSSHTIQMPPMSPHTGPSRYGSPLYRNQMKRDETCSSQSHVQLQTPPKYFRATPTIEKTLQRSLSAYKVTRKTDINDEQSSIYNRRPVSSFPNFMLIPNLENDSYSLGSSTNESEVTNANYINYSFLSWKKNQARNRLSSMFPEPDTFDVSEDGENEEDTGKMITDVAKELDKIKRKKSSHSSHDSLRSHHAGNSKSEKPKETKDSKKSSQQEKSTTITKGDQLTTPRDQSNTTASKSTEQKSGSQNKVTKSKKEKKDKKKGGNDLSSSSTLCDVPEEPQLPNYICPSSEEKSKESRIRHWLRDTTFTCANKHVPLV